MDSASSEPKERFPLSQVWPAEFVAKYREKGYWRGETIPGFLEQNCQNYADQIAIVGGATRWTYAELGKQIEIAANGFLNAGLKPGDRVIVQLGNIPEFISVVCGLFRAGIIPVFALPAHRISEISHFAKVSEANGYVISHGFESFDFRSLARELKATAPEIEHVFVVGEPQEFIAISSFASPPPALPEQQIDPGSVAFLQISGGSTGLPKLIPRTHDDYIYSFRASNEICGINEQSVYLVALPVAHNFPMSSPGFLGALYTGATVVLSYGAGPDAAFPLIEKEKVTCVGLVPPLALLWSQAAENTAYDLSSLQVMQVGGAKLVAEAARRVIANLGCTLQQVFGMAEGLVNYTRLDDSEHLIVETQGRPISPDDEILVVNDQDQPVPKGETGHLLTRGPYTIRAYHNDAAANARAFTDDGFYRTGDMVKLTPEGYLVVQGRATDHINRAGEKISAEEIENHLLAHPQVFDAAVVSIPDAHLGEKSCAFVIPNGEKPKQIELKAWVRNQGLAAFKVPDQIVFVEEFGTTAVGKISRRELRAELRQKYLEQKTKDS